MLEALADAPQRAKRLWEMGTERLRSGEPGEALKFYEQSIAVQPTAEGYTYRGWAFSYLGRLDEAIENCKKAIELDPDYGNPYNDIGVYLMQQGKLREAIPWLEQAIGARRYEPRHFPHLNLGRIYAAQGEEMRALDEFLKALELNPDDEAALEGIRGINYTVQ